MLADIEEFLRAASTFMELKHRLLEALLNGRPIALDYAKCLREHQAKFEMFVRLNSIAILHRPNRPTRRIPCPSCRMCGRNTSLLSEIELRPRIVEFWSALDNCMVEMHILIGCCEECGELLVATNKEIIRRLFSGFAGDRWWFIDAGAKEGVVVKNWGKQNA